ncbi:hypothetical protein DPEC_G00017450 [Dallia pectoralis]|uniref:Uncharacterized protein n=1 Tax=Dallia pectoralis TaxID=75939 RepID=A0ACC2HFG4_DALPE|nr:hypothetical protein DPEC_G00017450 [Dallia pectoralis]
MVIGPPVCSQAQFLSSVVDGRDVRPSLPSGGWLKTRQKWQANSPRSSNAAPPFPESIDPIRGSSRQTEDEYRDLLPLKMRRTECVETAAAGGRGWRAAKSSVLPGVLPRELLEPVRQLRWLALLLSYLR